MGEINWKRIKGWIRYWIGHRTFGGPAYIEDIPMKRNSKEK